MISEKFFCKKCKYSGSEIPNESGCQSLFNTHGWDNVECLDFDKGGIADETNAAWLEVMPNLADRNKLKSGHFSVNSGKLMVKGEKEDMIEDTEFEIKKKKKGDGTYDWFFTENGTEKSYTTDYLKSSSEELAEQKDIMKNIKSVSDKIEEKLRDIFFYSVNEKTGKKEQITFSLEDKKDIEQELRDLSNQNITGDKSFVMAVVRALGSDKEGNPIVKLGSYPKDSNVNLGFEERGLGSLLGTQYFSIVNNEGPDSRDFEIKKGDIYDNIEFKKENEKEEKVSNQPMEKPVKEEPYEEVMRQKERKGLASLVDTNEVNNNFTKKQKELIEKLKKGGYLFKRPVDELGYDVKNVKSSEFTESFKVWKKKS